MSGLDAPLAAVAPQDPLFARASRMRIVWRILTDDAGRAREALALIDAAEIRSPSKTWHDFRKRALSRATAGVRPPS